MKIFRRTQFENEMDAELRFHIAQYVNDLVRSGVERAEAERRARIEFGALEATKEDCRQAWGLQRLDELWADILHTLRTLRRNPGFAAIAILSLGLGIGATTAVFSLMDVLLIRPLPVAHPERLALINPDRNRFSFSYPLFRQFQDRNGVFSSTFAWSYRTVQVPEGADMLLVPAVYGSGDYFRTLGVDPVMGRVFGPEDDRSGGGANGPVAGISSGLWARKYGSSPAAIGKTMVINGVAVIIIGVMPPGFFGAQVGTAPD
ncbi:MAG TPA: ABC transporter permease, partial [Bryobacteraceae bacterium]|nr:ABC transporter permease [Bryobacteraceae bacterium]